MDKKNTYLSALPPLYSRWMEQLLGGPIPPESDATCTKCAMLRPEEGDVYRDEHYFHPDAKCCTFVPNLPNFLVGQALSDSDKVSAEGRATLERRIAGRLAITPLGCDSSAAHDVLYDQSASGAFGQSIRLRCPHYLEEGGTCGVWRYRNSVCSTWYCIYLRGTIGQRFWEALHQVLEEVEDDLACWCMAELVTDVGPLRHLFPSLPADGHRPLETDEVDEIADPVKYRAAWGRWLNREHDFFRQCGRLVGQLSWNDVANICGSRLTLLARLAKAAYAELLSEELPTTLRVGSFNIRDLRLERCRLTGDTLDCSLDVPRVLLRALPYFDGRPWPKAVVDVETQERIKLDNSLVRKLVDFDILVPDDGKSECEWEGL
jgi:hypothetical protein